ncbi:hypothetical protein Hamer_G006640 [Homarus americanus]|uniref:Uncharacterized protein n=1 Tax=Homarus americanus TaxID=6706 RepID=A0A8J5MM82_HOMAM|nr:hypothetical protein Hamer_G006640 [Homarus americanus]
MADLVGSDTFKTAPTLTPAVPPQDHEGEESCTKSDLLLASSQELVKHFFQDIIFCDDSPTKYSQAVPVVNVSQRRQYPSVVIVVVYSGSKQSIADHGKEIAGGVPVITVLRPPTPTRSPPVHHIYQASWPHHKSAWPPPILQTLRATTWAKLDTLNLPTVVALEVRAYWRPRGSFLNVHKKTSNPQAFAAVLDSTLAANSPSQTSKENVLAGLRLRCWSVLPTSTHTGPLHSSNSHMSAEYNINPSGCDASLTASVCTVSHASQPDSSNTSLLPPSLRQPTPPPLYILPSTTSTSGNYFIMQMTDGSQACQMVPMSLAHSQLNRPPASQHIQSKVQIHLSRVWHYSDK